MLFEPCPSDFLIWLAVIPWHPVAAGAVDVAGDQRKAIVVDCIDDVAQLTAVFAIYTSIDDADAIPDLMGAFFSAVISSCFHVVGIDGSDRRFRP